MVAKPIWLVNAKESNLSLPAALAESSKFIAANSSRIRENIACIGKSVAHLHNLSQPGD
jgi:hypothetical protein